MKKINESDFAQYAKLSKKFDQKLLAISVVDCGEGFVDLQKLCQQQAVKIIFADNKTTLYFLRKSVALSLLKVAQAFEKQKLTLKLESAYRKLSSQKQLFLERVAAMKKEFPTKTHQEILFLANTYTAGIPILAAHTAGAAVDVTLLDENNQALDFGVPYNHGGIESATDFPKLSKKVKKNRKTLKEGMEKFGFINYPFEYWHFSIGDVCATHLLGKDCAIFQPAEFDQKTNKVLTLPAQNNYKFFTTKEKI